MLTSLLGSRARGAVLARLLLHPEDELYLRDLASQTGLAPRGVQIEADRLVELGLLEERRYGNRRYLRANVGHTLFDPLRQLLERTVGVEATMRQALTGQEAIHLALLYGSYASGEAKPGSDVDLLIVGDLTLRKVVQLLNPVQRRLHLEINPIVMTEREFRRRRRTREHFIAALLKSRTISLVASPDDTR